MFAGNSKDQMLPFLFSLVKNGELKVSEGFSETSVSFSSVAKMQLNDGKVQPGTLDNIGKVAMINIHHPIFKYDQNCGPKGSQSIMNMMEEWRNDQSIRGVILNFNSGGGQASGNAEFAEYVKEYSKEKPVVSFTKDLLGSAAYYMASASNYIIAHKHADFVGSIGAMTYKVNLEGVLKNSGATIHELYADSSSEKNAATRALKDGDERPLIEQIINPLAEKFQNDVRLYRPQVSEKALKGNIFNPQEALNEGLIDEIGTLQDAINKVFSIAQENKGNSNNNNSKQNIMSEMNYPNIEGVLGNKFEEDETKNGIILTDEQAIAIEQQLADNANAISTASTEAEQSSTRIIELENNATEVSDALKNALETAGIESTEEMSVTKQVAALSEKLQEYAGKDGDSGTKTINGIDNGTEINNQIVGGVDISAAMNN